MVQIILSKVAIFSYEGCLIFFLDIYIRPYCSVMLILPSYLALQTPLLASMKEFCCTIEQCLEFPITLLCLYSYNLIFLPKSTFYFVSEAQKFKNNFFFFRFFFWGGTSQIFIFKQLSTHFFTEWMVYYSYIIRWFFFRTFIRFPDFSGYFPDFH